MIYTFTPDIEYDADKTTDTDILQAIAKLPGVLNVSTDDFHYGREQPTHPDRSVSAS